MIPSLDFQQERLHETYAMVHTPSESVAEMLTCPFALMTVFTSEHSA